MPKQLTKKFHSFQLSTTRKVQMFQAKLPYQQITFSDENQQSLFAKLLLEVKDVKKMKVQMRPHDDHNDTPLFLLNYDNGKHIFTISQENISCIEEFCYRLGILSDVREERKEALMNAEWTQLDDAVICKVFRPFDKDVKYYALGWFDTLPEHVLEKAKKNSWMINLASYREAKEMLQDHKDKILFYTEIYSGDGLLPLCLSSIPVSFSSVSSKTVNQEEKEYIDILHLRNLENFFEYTRAMWGTDRMIKTPLDLFDAMVSLQLPWKVDRVNELIYLPCIPTAPKRSATVYTTSQLPSERGDHKNVLDLYNNSDSGIREEILETMFPYLSNKSLHGVNMKLIEKELIRRLGLCGKKLLSYGFGKLNMYLDKVFCMLPPTFA